MTTQLLSLTYQHQVLVPSSADDVTGRRRTQDAGMSHQQHAIRCRLRPMVAEKIQATRGTQRMRPAETHQKTGSHLDLITIRQRTVRRDSPPVDACFGVRLEQIAFSLCRIVA